MSILNLGACEVTRSLQARLAGSHGFLNRGQRAPPMLIIVDKAFIALDDILILQRYFDVRECELLRENFSNYKKKTIVENIVFCVKLQSRIVFVKSSLEREICNSDFSGTSCQAISVFPK